MGWAGFSRLSTDVAYYQGDYWPDGNVTGVIVNVARGNQGSYQETTWGSKQISNARAAGKSVGFYFFNGNLNAYTCGVLFAATLRKLGFDPDNDLVAIDCEDEPATGTHSWGPSECANFIDGILSTGLRVSWSNVLIYMNYTVNRRFNWSGPVSWGARLWYARPGGPLDQWYWPAVTMKQDGLYNGVDADGHDLTYREIIGNPIKKKGKNSMSTLYYSTVPTPVPADYAAIGAASGTIYALAGDGEGEGAWLETQDSTLANQLAGFHSISQGSVHLEWPSYLAWKEKYTKGAPVASVNIDSAAFGDAVKAAIGGLSFTVNGQIKEG